MSGAALCDTRQTDDGCKQHNGHTTTCEGFLISLTRPTSARMYDVGGTGVAHLDVEYEQKNCYDVVERLRMPNHGLDDA